MLSLNCHFFVVASLRSSTCAFSCLFILYFFSLPFLSTFFTEQFYWFSIHLIPCLWVFSCSKWILFTACIAPQFFFTPLLHSSFLAIFINLICLHGLHLFLYNYCPIQYTLECSPFFCGLLPCANAYYLMCVLCTYLFNSIFDSAGSCCNVVRVFPPVLILHKFKWLWEIEGE